MSIDGCFEYSVILTKKIIEILRATNFQIQDTRLQFGDNRSKAAATVEMKRPLPANRRFFAVKSHA
jgi:hypothetical protein